MIDATLHFHFILLYIALLNPVQFGILSVVSAYTWFILLYATRNVAQHVVHTINARARAAQYGKCLLGVNIIIIIIIIMAEMAVV